MEHISVDLLSGVDSIAKALQEGNVNNVDYVFFTAYKESSEEGLWSGQQQMWDENGKMLEDFLVALHEVNGKEKGKEDKKAEKKLKRVVLQTG